MLLMIDNYDSFTYNLVQYFGELGVEVRVFRNDQLSVDAIEEQQLVTEGRERAATRACRHPRRAADRGGAATVGPATHGPSQRV